VDLGHSLAEVGDDAGDIVGGNDGPGLGPCQLAGGDGGGVDGDEDLAGAGPGAGQRLVGQAVGSLPWASTACIIRLGLMAGTPNRSSGKGRGRRSLPILLVFVGS
jgi:hypothetical protein